MTNSYNDMQNTRCALYIGSNAAEAHPVSMLHMLHAKETGAKMIVVDLSFTRKAAKADAYVRIRSGSDIAFLFGLLHHIFKNGWEDKQYIHDRVYGMDKVRDEVMTKWTPDKVEEVCGVPEARVLEIATLMAKNRPSTLVWCMGQTQHTIGNAIVRASCIVQLALGNVGVSGGGANIFRGHDNVQGATDVGPNPDSLPGYYGLAAGSWKHFAAVWGVDYDWIKSQFASQAMMEKPGMTVSRWIDGVMEKNELIDQDSNLRAMVFWGHAPNSQTRGMEMQAALQALDTLVVVDPYPSATAAMAAMPPTEQSLAILNKAGLKPNPNRAVYRLHRPVTRAFEAAHEEPEHLRREDPSRQRRTLRRRLLWPAVAVLRNARDQAPGVSQPVRRVPSCDGRRRLLPRQFRHRARWRQSSGRGRLVSQGLRAYDRLPRVRSRIAEKAGLVGRSDRCREKSRRRQELEDRSFRRHPAGRAEARLPSFRQCQGTRHRLEFPRRDSAT